MIGTTEASVGASVWQDHLADHCLGQRLFHPFLAVEDIGGGGLLGLDAEFDDRFPS